VRRRERERELKIEMVAGPEERGVSFVGSSVGINELRHAWAQQECRNSDVHAVVNRGRSRSNARSSVNMNMEGLAGTVAHRIGVPALVIGAAALGVRAWFHLDHMREKARLEPLVSARTSSELNTGYFIATPASKPRGVVVVVHEFFGLSSREIEFCNHLASNGYVAVAPDVFQGHNTRAIPRALWLVRDPAFKNRWESSVEALYDVVVEISAQFDQLPIVIAGFCIGGGIALRFAEVGSKESELVNIAGVGVFYGNIPSNGLQIAPHVPLYLAYGKNDFEFPLEKLQPKLDNLQTTRAPGVTCDTRLYENKNHAFIPGIDAVLQPDADPAVRDAWTGFEAFVAKVLTTT